MGILQLRTVADVLLVLSEFGCMSGCTADVDGDGYVNVADLLLLLINVWYSLLIFNYIVYC